MLHKRPTRWNRLRRELLAYRTIQLLMEFAAGIDAAHGLAHGIPPSQDSAIRAHRDRPARPVPWEHGSVEG